IGFAVLSLATTIVLARWPLTYRVIAILAIVSAVYFMAWQFVQYRATSVDLLISSQRAFALMGSAIFFETAVVRLSFMVTNAIASQGTRSPFDDPAVWTFTIPFAAASLLVTMLLDRQLSFLTGLITAVVAGLLAQRGIPAMLYAFISCAMAAYGIKRYRERQAVTMGGLLVAAVNVVAAVAMTAFTHLRFHPFVILISAL